jgi:hypothetical protein
MGFGHLGFVVDDVPALVKRVQEAGALISSSQRDTLPTPGPGFAGYKVVKPQGVCTVETIGWPTGTPEPIKAYQELYHNMAMIQVSVVLTWTTSSSTLRLSRNILIPCLQDPDGYWMELVPKVMEKK